MANQLIKSKWKAHTIIPNFGRLVEHVSQYIKKPPPLKFQTNLNPIGIEVEVEGWNYTIPPLFCWEPREDGSLKDHGREFVSHILSGVLIDYALDELKRCFGKHALNWSHRTSIHIHTYIGDMPVVKLKWLIAYYALIEPLWYTLCDEKRIGNSFCFPLCSVNPHTVGVGKGWPKYCGLNLGTSLVQFNTAEFRQMHGHQDWELYVKWIKKITKFIDYIKNTPIKKLQQDLDHYLLFGKIDFEPFFEDVPNNVNALIYDNAKWVADYLHTKA